MVEENGKNIFILNKVHNFTQYAVKFFHIILYLKRVW